MEPADFTTPIAGLPALVRAVHAVREVAPVTVVVPDGLAVAAAECLAAHGLSASVSTGWPQHDADAVVIHDVRYPLAPADLTARVAGRLAGCDVVVPILAMTDSVKVVGAQGIIGENVDRDELRTVQYPRGYSAAAFRRMVEGEDLMTGATTVEGDPNAFAVDLTRDRALLEAIVGAD